MVAIDVVHWFSLSIGELLHQKKFTILSSEDVNVVVHMIFM